ncbi:MAG TPA: GTPase ObgE [Clostridia bacterium]|nr:GTPase ObgE [Clostridia bacterium]
MFIDYVNIFIKAGDGGDGTVSFRREKYVPNGGPDGGDGGIGGSVYFKVNPKMRTLMDFRYNKHYRAENGQKGSGNNSTGANGKDLIIYVPPGTVIKDAKSGAILVDMMDRPESVMIMQGGKGGRGNARFSSSTRQAPTFAEPGTKTTEKEVILELKSIADVGLIGYPNVGKSTILSVISNARPKIANYHFTTLTPNFGIVQAYGESFVVADIPGLIEGAHVGVGLGHEFLRHIERTRLLIHVIDISGSEGRDPVDDYYKINSELEKYSPILAQRPQIIAANKADLVCSDDNIKRLRDVANTKGIEIFEVSAVRNSGFKPLINRVYEMLQTLPPPQPLTYDVIAYTEDDNSKYEIKKVDESTFEVKGGFVDRLLERVNLDNHQSMLYFQRVLREKGIIDELRRSGAGEGTVVRMGDMEFDYME